MEMRKVLDKETLKRIFFGQFKERNILVSLLMNIGLSYALLFICRIIFVLMNYGTYSQSFEHNSLWEMAKGSLLFDTAAVCYLNIPYAIFLLLPLHYKEGKVMQHVTRWGFVLPNALGVIVNLCDCVYVRYSGRRTTWTIFSEFGNEGNMGDIIGHEILNHWWLVIIGIAIIWSIYRLYTPANKKYAKKTAYYLIHVPTFAIIAFLLVTGMRGGIGKAVRPITLSNANKYIKSPDDAAIIMNTPFTLIRTIGKKPFVIKEYFSDQEVEEIYTPLRQFSPDSQAERKNVVIIIVESFGKEYIGAYNPRQEGSLTPFLDSLVNKSTHYRYSYGNGKKSIDGMPSILSSIPMFVEPFLTTPEALNEVSGIAEELGKTGYSSAFFHGAPNGSMGFQAFAKTTGFDKYYGKDEFCQSPDFGGEKDFDGTWAIWDEPFLQYYADCMNSMKEPFVTSVFTASSHHPFKIPEKYKERFKGGEDEFLKCVQYTDHSLRMFFEHASRQRWYYNTLFVITADHTNHSNEERYKTSAGWFEIPVIFFSPSADKHFPAIYDEETIAQQIDIMPTVLEYVGYDRPFVAFGKSLISTTPEESYAINFTNEIFQYYKGNNVLLYDGEKSMSIYNLREDPLMEVNIMDKEPVVQEEMEREAKAIIQQYMTRMVQDRLTIETDKKNAPDQK